MSATGPAEPSDQEAEAYFRAVEAEFVRLRGAAMLLAPRDWDLIGRWREAGIPLRIVLQGIANVFEARRGRAPQARRINSVSYCRQEVESLHEVFLALGAAAAGRPDAGGPDAAAAIGRHLGRLARRVRAAMAAASEEGADALVAALARAAAELKRARRALKDGSSDPLALEAEVRALDESVVAAAAASLAPEARRELEAAVEADLAGHAARMSPEALETTRGAARARRLRERRALPRLALFDP